MKTMKRRISLMLLAGILATSLASCVVDGGDEPLPNTKEPTYEISSSTGDITPTPTPSVTDPAQVSYTAVDDFVYVSVANITAKLVSDVTQTKVMPQLTELHRVGKAANWCKVEFEGQEYYVATKSLTEDDIGEKTFVECDKTLYNMGDVNVRKYASSNNDFSSKLTTIKNVGGHAVAIKVVAQSELKGWSKVEVTYDGKEYTGFMSTKYLTTNSTGKADDFDQHFEVLSDKMNMYVSVDQVAVRERPYAGGDDAGAEKGLLKRNDKVTVVGKGTVEGMDWCAIEYQNEAYENVNYFVAADCLSVVGGDLDQLLDFYKELERFSEPKTFYVSADKAYTRSTPAVRNDNSAGVLEKTNEVKAVAMGVFEQEGGSSSMTWCLIEDGKGGYCFISYGVLTSNADGTPAPAVTDVNELMAKYGFTAVSGEISKKFKVDNSGLYGEPTTTVECKKLEKGTIVKVVAEGETTTKYGTKNPWYIVEYNGYYYFVLQNVLENA